jgi:hypothetical protein
MLKLTKLLGIATFHFIYWWTEQKIFKKKRTEHFGAPRLFSFQSPINWAFTKRKRKYIEEKTTATLSNNQTTIAMI